MYKKIINRKSASKWDQSGERILIDIWAEKINQLRGCRKNSHIISEMALEMEAQGVKYTPDEIKTKMHNMTNRYREVKRGIKKRKVTSEGWDVVKEMEILFKYNKSNDSKTFVFDSINNINSSITNDPLSSSINNSLLFPQVHEYSAPTYPLKPPDSPSSSRSSESSSSDTSFLTAKKKKKEFDKFFENLEQAMEQINEDIKTTMAKMITIEEEKRDILKIFVEREGEVQEALLEFLKRN